jgi:hypothetical protein
MRQRFAVNNGSLGGDRSAGIDADQTDIGRNTARGHLLACQDFDKLLFPARGILGGEGRQLNVAPASCNSCLDAAMASGLLSSMPMRIACCAETWARIWAPSIEFVCLALHQRIVGGDIGFAFSAVNKQRFDRARRPGFNFTAVGKPAPPMPAMPGFRIRSTNVMAPVLASRRCRCVKPRSWPSVSITMHWSSKP